MFYSCIPLQPQTDFLLDKTGIDLILYLWAIKKNLVPWGTDGRLPLSDLDLDVGSGHTAYRRASFIDLYLHTKFH